jgi:hypothetical protein
MVSIINTRIPVISSSIIISRHHCHLDTKYITTFVLLYDDGATRNDRKNRS